MSEEIWKEIPGFPFYAVSNLGDIKRTMVYRGCRKKEILSQQTQESGHKKVKLTGDFGTQHFFVHRLVAMLFIGDPPTDSHVINHKDGNPANNHVTNLEWVTRSENTIHARDVLKKKFGFLDGHKSVLARYSDDEIRKIRHLSANGFNYVQIANLLGNKTTNKAIHLIVKRITYKNVA